MGWIEKNSTTIFDHGAVPGFYYINGDYFVHAGQGTESLHKKMPGICFPSGVECALIGDNYYSMVDIKVRVFRDLVVPLLDYDHNAYRCAYSQTAVYGYQIEEISDGQFVVQGFQHEHFLISYDIESELRCIMDIKKLPNRTLS